MNSNTKIAVLGGGGRTGKFLVTQLLQRGHDVRLLLRNPDQFSIENPSSKLETLHGDAVDPEAIHTLLAGCDAVISTVGQRPGEPMVSSQATANVLQSMAEHGIRRYIVLAGLNLDTPFDKKSEKTSAATKWMKQHFPEPHADRQKTYDLLVASVASWTQVRVPLIEFSDRKGELVVSLEDCLGDGISAGDIATFLVDQLSDEQYVRQSPFIAHQ